MTMRPRLRKLALTLHVTCSVGWLGAVGGFLALSVAGLTSRDADMVRGAYLAMNVIGGFVIVPLSLVALATGLIESLGTRWGLFRHYWGVVKLVLTVGATFLLLLHQFAAVAAAPRRATAAPPGAMPDVGRFGVQLVADSALAVVVLAAIATIGIYKPWGRTPYGRRKQASERNPGDEAAARGLPSGLRMLLVILGAILLLFAALHLAGRGLGGQGM